MIVAGKPLRIRSAHAVATIDTLGATLTGLWMNGESVLAGPTRVEPSWGHHGAVLAPWPNRLENGRYTTNGVAHQLPINDPAYGHAIHGLVFDQPWHVSRQTDSSVTVIHTVKGVSGYPFHIMITVSYSLVDMTLRCDALWENLGGTAAPFGVGFHPYFRPGPSPMSEWLLELPSSSFLGTDPHTALPGPRRDVGDSAQDFRVARPIGDDRFSLAYERTPAEVTLPIRLTDPAGWTLTVETSEAFGWIQVFSGHLPTPELSRTGLAIEPQTCAPNAFVITPDEVMLKPGEQGSGFWSVHGSRPPGE
ncbi:MAG: hypothetical protein ACOH19_07865 [Rhodoglobus sp.]